MDKKAFRYALVQTMPVMIGYLFVGAAFGLLLADAGYGLPWAAGMALIVYGGSLQFALLPMITAHTNLLTVAVMSLSISSRQMFYGLSLIERFKKMGKKALYMIYSLCDETYSVLITDVPEGIDRQKFDFYVAALDMCYWVSGCSLGNLFGALIPFDTTGIDFAMIALFVVICTEQWIGSKNHLPAITGMVCGVVSLILFGADSFILPALASSMLVLMLVKNKVEVSENE
ncbi:MAG: AzlC family ABC transporter permease [Oscillospiraceae bacterium]|nr:AzlC family ABC transporter permease [Oscillospiraceae bacterium]